VHFRVGLLVLAAGSLFVALIAFTIGSSMRTTIGYRILFTENIKGMVVGSKVNFQGVPAGAVTAIRFADGCSLVDIEVGEDLCEVQDVTRARIDRLLVTGQVTVELEGYERGRRRLPAGAFIPPVANPIGEITRQLPDVVDSVPSVLREATELLSRLNRLLDDDNCRRIDRILIHVEQTAAKTSRALDEIVPYAERAAREAVDVLKQADATLADARAGIADLRALLGDGAAQRLLGSLADAATRLAAVQHDLGALAADARSLLAGNRASIGDALLGFRDAMREVRALARMLQLAPSSLVFGRQPGEPAAPPGGER